MTDHAIDRMTCHAEGSTCDWEGCPFQISEPDPSACFLLKTETAS